MVTFTEGILKAKSHFLCSVTIDGGASNIFENERTLLQWALVVRYIANMIRGSGKNSTNMYHKYTELFEKDLLAKHFLLIQSFLKFDDSFTNPLDVVINMIFMDGMSKNA